MGIVVGWPEIVLVAILILLGILYRVYWVRKRNLVAGLIFLILGSAFCLFTGLGAFVALWDHLQRIGMPFQVFEYVTVAFAAALAILWNGLGIYYLLTAIKALRVMGSRVLKYRVPRS